MELIREPSQVMADGTTSKVYLHLWRMLARLQENVSTRRVRTVLSVWCSNPSSIVDDRRSLFLVGSLHCFKVSKSPESPREWTRMWTPGSENLIVGRTLLTSPLNRLALYPNRP